MRAVERELYDDDVVVKIETVEFAMHVGKCSRVDVNGEPDILAVIFFPGTHIVKVPAFGEPGDKAWGVLGLGLRQRIKMAN
jgi:uncharacterized protein (UPF0218 family)